MSIREVQIFRAAQDTLREALAADWPDLQISPEMQFVLLGQVWGESRFGATADWGESNNWGAVTYHKGDGKWVEHTDHTEHGKRVTVRFQAYDTQLDAARDWLRILMRGGTPKAIAASSIIDMAAAMYANRYYTGVQGTAGDRIAAYASMLRGGASHVRAVLETAALQEELAAAGFDPGPIDGVRGPRTEAAVRARQQSISTQPEIVDPPSEPEEPPGES